jgi:eukaryotic-like serine/threonine-protein kinase
MIDRKQLLEKVKTYAKEFWWFVSSKIFLKSFAGILAMFIGFFVLVALWLHLYTKHGQSITVPNFENKTLEDAVDEAERKGLNIVVTDSIYKKGKMPHTVLDQNPKAMSQVKEDRTIYITISRAAADLVPLPDIAGGNDDFEQYQRKLTVYDINAEVIGRKFDPILEPNTIIDVIFDNDTITNKMRYGVKIPKGSILYFVVSERENPNIQIPDLVCKNFEAAKFLINSSQLNIGSIVRDASVVSESSAYVWKQEPIHQPNTTMRIGEQITLYITQRLPAGCDSGAAETTPDN